MKKKLRNVILFLFELYSAIKREYFSKKVGKPKVINFQANDICNSKCQMCNIWRQKQDVEISPDQLGELLSDDLFSEVKSVGITGGEPTLREDLPQLYEAFIKALPSIKGLSSITNAIKADSVIETLSKCGEICDENDKRFSVMVSLDGVGDVHDEIRGRKGNFDSALKVIEHFTKNTNYPVTIGCTITKDNLWHVDDLLEFLKENNLYGRFRVAEYIQRLYNEEQTEIIRCFDDDESYHLATFFKKLELDYETNTRYQRTYRSIQNMLLGGKRQIGCPYQSEAVSLDSKGDLAYCAPKSKNLGSVITQSAKVIYESNIDERDRIATENCSDCIHDYHADSTFSELKDIFNATFWLYFLSLKFYWLSKWFVGFLVKEKPNSIKSFRVLIVGWYGTETVGDKAILAGIMNDYIDKYGESVEFIISAICPFITERTLVELNLKATVIDSYSRDFVSYSASVDEVVMGGGPLMNIESLSIPLYAFTVAKKYKRKTVIFGCGIGPLKEKVHLTKFVEKIIKLSDVTMLRDQKSCDLAEKMIHEKKDISRIDDPARSYLLSLSEEIGDLTPKPYLACFIREWTTQYKEGITDQEFERKKLIYEKKLASEIRAYCESNNLIPAFYPMGDIVFAKDDREYARYFVKKYLGDLEVYIERRTASVDSTIKAMKSAHTSLSMRFHSVVFAETLGVNYFAFDYTNGGKISSFIKEKGKEDKMVTLDDFIKGDKLLK